MILYEVAGEDDIRPSPYCWRARWALLHKQIEFEVRPLAYTAIGTIGDGRFRRVPVLEHEGTLLAESFDIALYLDTAFPDRPRLFRGESGTAFARFLDGWTETAIHDPTFGMVVADMWRHLKPVDQGYFRTSREGFLGCGLEAAEEGRELRLPAFQAGLAPLSSLLENQAFLGGEGPDYGDYIVASAFRWLAVVSDFAVVPADGPISGWLKRLETLRG